MRKREVYEYDARSGALLIEVTSYETSKEKWMKENDEENIDEYYYLS